AANRNPRRPETWIQIGFCKVKQGRNEEAIRAYKRALQLKPNSAEGHNKLGDAYFYAGRFDEAIASYKDAARVQPDQAEAYYNLGLAYLEIGDRAAALAQSKLLEPIDPDLNRKLLVELQRYSSRLPTVGKGVSLSLLWTSFLTTIPQQSSGFSRKRKVWRSFMRFGTMPVAINSPLPLRIQSRMQLTTHRAFYDRKRRTSNSVYRHFIGGAVVAIAAQLNQ